MTLYLYIEFETYISLFHYIIFIIAYYGCLTINHDYKIIFIQVEYSSVAWQRTRWLSDANQHWLGLFFFWVFVFKFTQMHSSPFSHFWDAMLFFLWSVWFGASLLFFGQNFSASPLFEELGLLGLIPDNTWTIDFGQFTHLVLSLLIIKKLF